MSAGASPSFEPSKRPTPASSSSDESFSHLLTPKSGSVASPRENSRPHRANENVFKPREVIGALYAAEPISGAYQEDIFTFLAQREGKAFVTGIKELTDAAKRSGFQTDIQFFRCLDRSQTGPVVLTFREVIQTIDAESRTCFGVPNVERIFDTPEERLRGNPSSDPHKKQVQAPHGVGNEDVVGGYGGALHFERFVAPCHVILTPSSDPHFHRPFDVTVCYSPDALHSALRHLDAALLERGDGDFNHLLHCVITYAVQECLSSGFIEFGPRETPEFLKGSKRNGNSLVLRIPVSSSGESKTCEVTVTLSEGAIPEVASIEVRRSR